MRSIRSLHGLRPHAASKKPFQQIRHFHPTRPSPFVSEVLDVSSGFVHGIHSVTHLPWVVSIPLTALIVRMTVALPLQIYSRVQARKERDITPLLMSWRTSYEKEAFKNLEDKYNMSIFSNTIKAAVAGKMRKKRAQLKKHWKVARFWKPVNLLQIPIWLSVMESIRAMSGRNGLFQPDVEPSEAAETAKAGSDALSLVEPSLANEGVLWFPDLLAGDPTGVLPVALTLSILLNIRTGWKIPSLKETADLPFREMVPHLALKGLRGQIFVRETAT
ncbi:hypothetical protein MW887_005230 [Aspergillus wentii]|nr:hypothetical protein MW887_005230 [Aspergillus wentii]